MPWGFAYAGIELLYKVARGGGGGGRGGEGGERLVV